ncbi:cross-pathway control WD-repeat protein cpc2 [Elasticomyces elasticus]|nr:cross-pathway control WD-repeat protein cpc2 [Elasticomyces elasticus]
MTFQRRTLVLRSRVVEPQNQVAVRQANPVANESEQARTQRIRSETADACAIELEDLAARRDDPESNLGVLEVVLEYNRITSKFLLTCGSVGDAFVGLSTGISELAKHQASCDLAVIDSLVDLLVHGHSTQRRYHRAKAKFETAQETEASIVMSLAVTKGALAIVYLAAAVPWEEDAVGRQMARLETAMRGVGAIEGGVERLRIAEGWLWACGEGETLLIWNLTRDVSSHGYTERSLHGDNHIVSDCSISSDGANALSFSWDKTLCLSVFGRPGIVN